MRFALPATAVVIEFRPPPYYAVVLKEYFKDKALCEITPFSIEKFKHERIKTPTQHGTPRAHASVNREFEMLSRLFNLAIDFKKAESNPCSRVRKFKLDNERYRYLLPEEEPILMNVLVNQRAHFKGNDHCRSWTWLAEARAAQFAA